MDIEQYVHRLFVQTPTNPTSISRFRKAGYQAIDRICDYYYSLEKQPVLSKVEPGYLKKHIPCECYRQSLRWNDILTNMLKQVTAPEQGEDFQVIADDYQKFIVPGLTHWQHPSFFAYFPTGCTFEGILADLYSTAAANPGFNWIASPACTELEALVMDWACRLLGLSPEFLNSSEVGGGVIQNTASDSALIAAVAARSLYQRDHPEVPSTKLVIYTTTQTHSLGLKAGLVLGLSVRILEVKAEDNFSLRGETLRLALEEDEKLGMKPFILRLTLIAPQSISLNQEFADFVAKSDKLSLVTAPSFALTVFRLDPKPEAGQSTLSLETLNQLNKLFYGRISARHDILLTPTVLNGVSCIRLAVGASRTNTVHIQQACELLHTEAELTLEEWKQTRGNENN
ncbi:hypothetical protein C0991_008797 [Blastosporella zonata]|nr:hypothetical protein C0991_008797 [Blastosporella zonata]